MGYWFAIVVIGLGVLFGMQNPNDVTLTLIEWQWQLPLSVLMLILVLFGIFIGVVSCRIQRLWARKST